LRRRSPHKPARPVPINSSVDGSGVAAGEGPCDFSRPCPTTPIDGAVSGASWLSPEGGVAGTAGVAALTPGEAGVAGVAGVARAFSDARVDTSTAAGDLTGCDSVRWRRLTSGSVLELMAASAPVCAAATPSPASSNAVAPSPTIARRALPMNDSSLETSSSRPDPRAPLQGWYRRVESKKGNPRSLLGKPR